MGLLHRPGASDHGAPSRYGACPGGDRDPGTDGPSVLRPPLPSQDVLPGRGPGNLLAAPLHGRSRKIGTTVFLDLSRLEPFEDQWDYLSTLERLTPREVAKLARWCGNFCSATRGSRQSTSTLTRCGRPPRSCPQATGSPRTSLTS